MGPCSTLGPIHLDQAIYNIIAHELHEVERKRSDPKKRKKNIQGSRNQAVLAYIDTALERDVAAILALVWGIGHRQTLSDGLEERGYRLRRLGSMTVATNPAMYAYQ